MDIKIKEMRVIKDGNSWCFVLPDFENLQISPSVWTDDGDTDIDAIYEQLLDQFKKEQHSYCYADRDGDCSWKDCPQLKDGEPMKTGRHCPLDNFNE